MRHSLAVIAAFGLGVVACDYQYDGPEYNPASPPGSTAALGSVTLLVDGETVTAALPTGATWRNNVFSFAALNAAGKSRTFALSVREPGPATFAVGVPGSPTISFLESDGATVYRWFATSQRGAGSVIRLGPQAALVSLDDRPADRQADTHAVDLGREERVEQLVHAVAVEAHAGVPHRQADPVAILVPGTDHDLSRAAVNADHGIRSVAEQIEDDLLQLDPISVDGRQVLRQLRPQDNVVPLKLAQ